MSKINTLKDLTYKMLDMADAESSPELLIEIDGKELVVKDFYLRGDNKAIMILVNKQRTGEGSL